MVGREDRARRRRCRQGARLVSPGFRGGRLPGADGFHRAHRRGLRAVTSSSVFELLVYPLPGESHQTTQYVEMADKRSSSCSRACASSRMPGSASTSSRSKVRCRPATSARTPRNRFRSTYDELGRLCGRPWDALRGSRNGGVQGDPGLRLQGRASGYLAGRAIWAAEPFKAFPDWEAVRSGLPRGESLPYMRDRNALAEGAATSWFRHPAYGGKVGVPPARARSGTITGALTMACIGVLALARPTSTFLAEENARPSRPSTVRATPSWAQGRFSSMPPRLKEPSRRLRPRLSMSF